MPCTGAASKGGTFVNIGRPEKIIIRFIYENYMDDIGKEGRGVGYSTQFCTWRLRPEVQRLM